MSWVEIEAECIERAREGGLGAIDALLTRLQPAVYNLAVRMLGNREDARDACQEILLKVVTHLATWHGQAQFATWVFQIARNHLATARTRTREHPEVSLESLEEKLGLGLQLAGPATTLTPEDKAEAREVALRCTQGMLMRLDRDQRLAYLLDVIFGLESAEAAIVLGISAAAYRKRLSRARRALASFSSRMCGLASPAGACQCAPQLPALRSRPADGPALTLSPPERDAAAARLDGLLQMSDAAMLFRAHPTYRAPDAMAAAIRTVLRREGYLDADRAGQPGA